MKSESLAKSIDFLNYFKNLGTLLDRATLEHSKKMHKYFSISTKFGRNFFYVGLFVV